MRTCSDNEKTKEMEVYATGLLEWIDEPSDSNGFLNLMMIMFGRDDSDVSWIRDHLSNRYTKFIRDQCSVSIQGISSIHPYQWKYVHNPQFKSPMKEFLANMKSKYNIRCIAKCGLDVWNEDFPLWLSFYTPVYEFEYILAFQFDFPDKQQIRYLTRYRYSNFTIFSYDLIKDQAKAIYLNQNKRFVKMKSELLDIDTLITDVILVILTYLFFEPQEE